MVKVLGYEGWSLVRLSGGVKVYGEVGVVLVFKWDQAYKDFKVWCLMRILITKVVWLW